MFACSNWSAALKRTSIPWCVFRPKDDCIPKHDVIWVWGAIDTLGWVLSQTLEVAHEPLQAQSDNVFVDVDVKVSD
jgi:hypothetical protein